jgi:hypothetical protein
MASQKENYPKIAAIIVVAFAIGFGVATGSFFFVFCENCLPLEPITLEVQLSPEEKCDDDTRCIPWPPIDPPPPISKKGLAKIKELQRIVNDPIIQEALKKSNQEFGEMSPEVREQIIDQRELEWTTADEETPFMRSIIYNEISDFLNGNLVIPSQEFGDLAFGEHILTNIYGPNVAVTVRTDNYDQSNDDWWEESERIGRPLVRQCDYDESAKMYSEDIVVKIFDKTGEFIGIMNSATPCDVTKKGLQTESKIKAVPFDNITEIGKYKISKLQELMQESIIQDALEKSNQEFSSRGEQDMVKLREGIAWPKPSQEPNQIQLEILSNEIAVILRNNLVMQSEFGEMEFPEMILTNAYGANIGSTQRTYNYIQSLDEWWQVAVANDVLVRECGWDKSIKMTSEDIIIAIYDDTGELAGVLNSATQCDVILNKSPSFYGDSN